MASFLLVALLLTCVVHAVQPESGGSESAPDGYSELHPVRVFLPNDHNLQWLNFWVAMGGGMFEDAGLEVELVFPPRPGGGAQFLLRGRADVAVMPRPMFLQLIGMEEPILVFANLLANDPVNLVVLKEVAEERGLSLDLALEDRLQRMEGLRIGVAPGPVTRLEALFADSGVRVEAVSIQGEMQNEALETGEVDALYAHTPYLERALALQNAVLVVNQSAGEVPGLSGRVIHAMVTTRSYAEHSPSVLVALSRGLYRAQQLIRGDPHAAVEAIRASGVQLEEPEGLEMIVRLYGPAVPDTPEVSAKQIVRELSLFPGHRTPPDLSGIDVERYVAPGYAREAVRGEP